MRQRVGIVGAGIVGLAHAWSAAQRGHQVTVFERSPKASGASIRNFGMIWPLGQPLEHLETAMLSRDRWLTLARQSNIWLHSCGSLHLAHRPEEWKVLQEFYQFHQNSILGRHLRLLGREESFIHSQAINPENFIGSLHCDLELCINPTTTIRAMPQWLEKEYGVQFHFATTVVDVSGDTTRTSGGALYSFDRVIVCSGHDFETLFPTHLAQVPLRKCKLQMLRTIPQAAPFQLGCHIASGLTLRHYNSFRCCSSLSELVARIANETPELDRYGIHVMAAQDDMGRIVLGDSHVYDSEIEPFDSALIDELMLRELHKVLRLPSWNLDSRWHGVYAKNTEGVASCLQPQPGVFICLGLGGAGMTLSFGLAEKIWKSWEDE